MVADRAAAEESAAAAAQSAADAETAANEQTPQFQGAYAYEPAPGTPRRQLSRSLPPDPPTTSFMAAAQSAGPNSCVGLDSAPSRTRSGLRYGAGHRNIGIGQPVSGRREPPSRLSGDRAGCPPSYADSGAGAVGVPAAPELRARAASFETSAGFGAPPKPWEVSDPQGSRSAGGSPSEPGEAARGVKRRLEAAAGGRREAQMLGRGVESMPAGQERVRRPSSGKAWWIV